MSPVTIPAAPHRSREVAIIAVVVVAMVAPLLPWLVDRLHYAEARSGFVLVVVGAVMWWRAAHEIRDGASVPRLLICAVGVGGAALLLASAMTQVRLTQLIGAVVVLAAAHAWAKPQQGMRVLCAAAIVCLGAPLAGDLDVLAFPLRLLSAQLAAYVLPLLGVMVDAKETVLVIEGNVADVEAPCAGMSTLRYVVAATLVVASHRGASVTRTITAVATAAAISVVGNGIRVTVLCLLTLGAHQSDVAALLHTPLGLMACLTSVLAAVVVVLAPTHTTSAPTTSRRAPTMILAVIAALTTMLRLTGPSATPTQPAILDSAIPLSDAEARLYGTHAERASKAPLPLPLQGEVITVVSTSLRAAHAPERCLAGSGYRVDVSSVREVDGVNFRVISLDGGARHGVSVIVGATHTATSAGEQAAHMVRHPTDRRFVFTSAVVDTSDATRDDSDARITATARILLTDAHALLGVSR